jgi:hypothetical protein
VLASTQRKHATSITVDDNSVANGCRHSHRRRRRRRLVAANWRFAQLLRRRWPLNTRRRFDVGELSSHKLVAKRTHHSFATEDVAADFGRVRAAEAATKVDVEGDRGESVHAGVQTHARHARAGGDYRDVARAGVWHHGCRGRRAARRGSTHDIGVTAHIYRRRRRHDNERAAVSERLPRAARCAAVQNHLDAPRRVATERHRATAVAAAPARRRLARRRQNSQRHSVADERTDSFATNDARRRRRRAAAGADGTQSRLAADAAGIDGENPITAAIDNNADIVVVERHPPNLVWNVHFTQQPQCTIKPSAILKQMFLFLVGWDETQCSCCFGRVLTFFSFFFFFF